MGKRKSNQDAELTPSCPQKEESPSAIRNGIRGARSADLSECIVVSNWKNCSICPACVSRNNPEVAQVCPPGRSKAVCFRNVGLLRFRSEGPRHRAD